MAELSLKASNADGFYRDPDWTPADGSLDKYYGKKTGRNAHGALGNRVKANGILVVRFEMPFNIWCTSCDSHIGRGVRYNARKKHVGMYHTTRIFEFDMNCLICKNSIVVRLNPKLADYDVVKGGRRQVKGYVPSANKETIVLDDMETKRRRKTDAMFNLERTKDVDTQKDKDKKRVFAIKTMQDIRWKDDHSVNAALRSVARGKRKHAHAQKDLADSRGLHHNNFVLLDNLTAEDRLSRKVIFQRKKRPASSSSASGSTKKALSSSSSSSSSSSFNAFSSGAKESSFGSSSHISKKKRTGALPIRVTRKKTS
jgi:coiled-coil domain-containing protein 130